MTAPRDCPECGFPMESKGTSHFQCRRESLARIGAAYLRDVDCDEMDALEAAHVACWPEEIQ